MVMPPTGSQRSMCVRTIHPQILTSSFLSCLSCCSFLLSGTSIAIQAVPVAWRAAAAARFSFPTAAPVGVAGEAVSVAGLEAGFLAVEAHPAAEERRGAGD